MATLLPAMAIVGAAMRLGTMTTLRVIMVTVIMATATAVMVMVIVGAGAMAMATVQGDMTTTAGVIMTALAMATIRTVMATKEATMPYHLTMPPPTGPMGRWTALAFR